MNSSLNIYTDFFGLSERPFSLVPDPDFLFWSEAHSWAFTMLEYGIVTRAPITLITGEVGAGKTTLVHHLIRTMEEDVRVAMIANASGGRGELLRWILQSLGEPAAATETYVDLFSRFQQLLIDEYAAGGRVVLIFDEAQNLSRDALEELRMFTNINANKDELLQIVLVGQPELRDTVNRPDLLQFAQRVSSAFHLAAMDRRTVAAYIAHRMQVAGAQHEVFNTEACDAIFDVTGGVPRLVNQLADLCLVYAFTAEIPHVNALTVEVVLSDGVFFPARRPVIAAVPSTPRTGTA
jgi:type II secretory pathway predicted ATPase ExeA